MRCTLHSSTIEVVNWETDIDQSLPDFIKSVLVEVKWNGMLNGITLLGVNRT